MNSESKVTAAMAVLHSLWPADDGPGHIVYADFNLEDHHIQWCIGEIDRGETYSLDITDPTHPIFTVTKAALEFLLDIPEPDRLAWAEHAHEHLWGWA